MNEQWQSQEHVIPVPVSSSTIISTNLGNNRRRNFLKWGAVLGAFIIVLGGAGSVVLTINQNLSNVGRVVKQRDETIRELLEETSSQTSFGLLSKVEAHENPLSPQNTYTNPFAKDSNPFDAIEP